MRIDRLDLIAFGPFTAESLDLSEGAHGLHVIHGPNEAGKSSSLRALRQLLFGVKHQTSDNFKHDYKDLRVGATLRHHDGSTLQIIRRKALKKSLFAGPGDEEEVEETLLADRFLGGISADTFEGMFTLDHASLSAGGKATLDANGQFAQILFGAGLDLPRLRKYQKALEAEMDGLFRPRGEKQKINLVLTQLEAARAAVQAASLRGPDWAEKTGRLDDLRREKARVDGEWSRLDRERKRLDRIARALPDLALRRALRAELAELGDGPSLAEDFADRRRGAQERLRDASLALLSSRSDRDRLESALAALPPRDPILDEADAVEALREGLAREDQAAEARAGKRRDREDSRLRERVHLADLGRDDPADAGGLARVSPGLKAQVRTLDQDRATLEADRDATRREIAACGREIDSLEAQLAALPAPRSSDGLRRALKRIEDRGDATAALASAAKDVIRRGRDVQALRARLGDGPTNLDALEALPVPPADVIEAFAARIAEVEARRDRHAGEVAEVEDALLELDARIARHELGDGAPDEESLRAARRDRDASWEAIRAAWLGNRPDPGGALGRAHEGSIRRADDLADRLRRDAGRLAEAARDRAERARVAARLEVARARRDEATAEQDGARREWSAAWSGVGVAARTPREMATWAADHARLIEKARALDEALDRVRSFEAAQAEGVAEIRREWVALGEPGPPDESDALPRARDRAQGLVEAIRDAASTRKELTRRRDDQAERLAAAEARRDEVDAELTAWSGSWGRAVRGLGLDGDATAEAALRTLDAIEKVFQARDAAAKLDAEIREGEAAAERYSARLVALITRIAPDLPRDDPHAAVAGLGRRLQAAREADARRAEVARERDAKGRSCVAAEAEIDAASRAIEGLCREAGATGPGALPEIEERVARRRAREAELAAVEARAATLAGGKTLDAFAAEAFEFDPDALPSLQQAAEEAFLAHDAARQALDTGIGEAQAEIRALEDTSRLARAESAAADREHLMGALDSAVDRYVHLKLSWAVLRDAIEEFRKRNQAPVLRRAGEAFAALTLGSFRDLRVDLNEKGDQPVLVGIRPDGKTVGVDGMSVGTVDALFLALKLALLDHYLDTHAALPLVVDDLLIQFDDRRAAAALGALADLSRRTQVLFFTHHDHLVELARSCVPGDALFVHRLGAPVAESSPSFVANGHGS